MFVHSAAMMLDDVGIATSSIWWVIDLSHAFYQSCCNLWSSRPSFKVCVSAKPISTFDSPAERFWLQAAIAKHNIRVSTGSVTLVGGELFVGCPIAGSKRAAIHFV